MAYIGKSIESGTFSVLDTSGNTYNGSNTTFNLGTQVGSTAQLLVSHDGVIQKPGTDYTLASGGTQITFTTAPASGASIFIVEISGAVGGPLDADLNGTELILDTDGDTSITADTDDQIDIKIAGADDFQFTANTFTAQSGSTIAAQALTATTLTATGDVSLNGGSFVFNEDSADVDFRVESNGNANMLVVNGGGDRVGIGADPDLGNGLHVKSADSGASVAGEADELVVEGSGDAGISILSGTGSTGSINFGDSGDNDIGRLVYNQDDNSMRFITNAGERIRVNSNGSASIGNTGSSSGDYSGTGDTGVFLSPSSSSGASTFAMTGDQCLTINRSEDNTSNLTMVGLRRQNSICGTIKGTNTTAQYNTSSDYRLKENVNYTWDATTRLKQLKPARFNWISDETNTLVDGFLAHEVTSIVPQATSGEKDAVDSEGNIDPQGIDHSHLVPLLTKALQEAITKIETLEARVTTLEG